MKVIDLTGQRFAYLSVIRRNGSKSNFAAWECLCDCGNVTTVAGVNLRKGHTTSCGCAVVKHLLQMNCTHGQTGSPTYRSWAKMKSRCYDNQDIGFALYGGRGITVCERWQTFENFLADMGTRPSGMTLDRVDPNGNYEPGNCKWSTALEQSRNRGYCLGTFEYEGQVHTISSLAKLKGLSHKTAKKRYARLLTSNLLTCNHVSPQLENNDDNRCH